jgi:hypothetical protein
MEAVFSSDIPLSIYQFKWRHKIESCVFLSFILWHMHPMLDNDGEKASMTAVAE